MNTLPLGNIPGEVIEKECRNIRNLEFVPLVDLPEVGKRQTGYFTLSNFRLRFHKQLIPENNDASRCDPIVNIPLGFIRDFKVVSTANNTKCELTFVTRLVTDLTFDIKAVIKVTKELIMNKFTQVAFPLDTKDSTGSSLFAFRHKAKGEPDPGWCYYERLRDEYERILSACKTGEQFWRIVWNQGPELIDSYPTFYYVPSKIDAEKLKEVAEFRTKRRLPVLCWCHPTKCSVIARSSQPRTGVGHVFSSSADQEYIEALRDSSLAEQLTIADARPKKNAIANMMKGGGTESGIGKNPTRYTAEGRTDVKFFEIDNIHVVRGSFEKLKNLVSGPPPSDFHEKLEKTGWLSYIQRILLAGVAVAEKIECESQSVLVHCSDGWDRTSQITCLAMIMLDSHYRTMPGFATLIEKEWLSFGHKFAERNGTGRQSSEKEESPIFLQFIECVWQMMEQFPFAFEFNTLFLIKILDGFYSNQYGTFLFSSDRERTEHQVQERCKSIWTDLLFNEEERRGLLNAFFNRNFCKNKGALLPSVSTRAMKFWRHYYFRHHPLFAPKNDLRMQNLRMLAILEAIRHNEASRKIQQQQQQQNSQSFQGHGGAIKNANSSNRHGTGMSAEVNSSTELFPGASVATAAANSGRNSASSQITSGSYPPIESNTPPPPTSHSHSTSGGGLSIASSTLEF